MLCTKMKAIRIFIDILKLIIKSINIKIRKQHTAIQVCGGLQRQKAPNSLSCCCSGI